jgi:outer membrane protein
MFLILLTFLLAPVHAQEVLTWDACVKEVITNNLDLKAARENVNSSKYKKKALWSEYLPSVNAGLNSSYGDSRSLLYSASLSVNQNLFSGFSSLGKTRGAEGGVESQEATYQSTRAKVGYDLMVAYAQVLYSKEYIKFSKDIIKRRADNLSLVQLRFEGGMENKGSYLLAKASLQDAEFDLNQSERLLETSMQQLAAVLGRKELAKEIEIDDKMPLIEPENNIDIMQLAQETPEHKIAKAQVKISKADLTVSRSNFYPSLDFTGAITQQGSRWPFPNSGWSAMLGLSFPLFSGGKDFFTTHSSASLLSASLFEQDQTDLQIFYKLRGTYNGLKDSIERVNVYVSYVDAAKTRAVISRNKYNNGLLSFENWDIIENDYISKQKIALQTIRDRHLAEAMWLMTQGKGVIQ